MVFGVIFPMLSFWKIQISMTLMLFPKSHRACLIWSSPMTQGMVKLPRSFNFSGSCSWWLCYIPRKLHRPIIFKLLLLRHHIFHEFCMVGNLLKCIANEMFMWIILKMLRNFENWSSRVFFWNPWCYGKGGVVRGELAGNVTEPGLTSRAYFLAIVSALHNLFFFLLFFSMWAFNFFATSQFDHFALFGICFGITWKEFSWLIFYCRG